MSCTVPDPLSTDIAVIGGGIIGLGIALEAQRAGHRIALIDPDPAAGATFAAAGMLAPVSELHYQEEDLLSLTLDSSARWPAFARMLAAETGLDPGFRTTPTLALGADAADRAALGDLREAQARQGLRVARLTTREARALEPMLSPNISAAHLIEQDHQVDPRALARAIMARLAAVGRERDGTEPPKTLVRARATTLLHEDPADSGSRVTGVRLGDGTQIHARETILANGLGAAGFGGLPESLVLPLRPVHGDILRLRVPAHLRPLTTATLRGMVRGLPVYVVPREDHTVVIGATAREDSSPGVSAGGVHQLLRDAQVLLPAVAELELIETTARARPGTPDNAPLLGRVAAGDGADVPGLLIATGFFRHGVLLTPVAAHIVLELVAGRGNTAWDRFRPDRFSPALQPKEYA
ncbi:glycine oxidase ThiO [Paeniglutamicibacter sp. ABSL32-1]|uniref:glycine oxidase ThiO n=1 Tax=Paeniglutamicibacter quisquiliarum TaxID=2849498 RepID=UPI001C2D99EC|nr:glycine oxidase ThiO [Paeniglutamicibacter quisquiliarum]MBV1781255.1 glycine oxidase ThiO [Paeniglutamicibacter quisquiliarum]